MLAGNPNITLAQYIANAEKKAGSPAKMWIYDAITCNCQYFTKWCLQGSGLWTPALERFVMQDAAKVIDPEPKVGTDQVWKLS